MSIKYIWRSAVAVATVALLSLSSFTTAAEGARCLARQQIYADFNRAGSNHYAYPEKQTSLTPAPAGYEPFYLDHYGRHGSRWLTKERYYTEPVAELEKAARNGKLTEPGRELLRRLRRVAMEAKGREGELSDVGAEQHVDIARRMTEHFPSIFTDDATIDARSTIWIRCILSMVNETGVLRAYNPRMRISTDASYADMYYMGWGYGEDTLSNRLRDERRTLSDSIFAAWVNPERFVSQLISDREFIADSINALLLMERTFDIAGSLQNHHAFDGMTLFDYFTADEIYTIWRTKNVYWYLQWANNPHSGNRMPFVERALLRNMIATADDAIANGRRGAHLRFGHETCVLPLTCLLEIDSVAYSTSDLESLHLHWQNYNIFPMACNVQMVFYRPVGKSVISADDVLVKVLLNEREVYLPFDTDSFPYYRWSQLRPYYLKKLDTPINWYQP